MAHDLLGSLRHFLERFRHMGYELVRSINAAAITGFHDAALSPITVNCAPPRAAFAALWRAIADNHRCNALLSLEEERASRIPIGDPDLSVCRYRIDRYNVERSAAVAAIDETLLDVLADVPRHRAARLYTETAGSMIDRLSTLAIRIHRMRLYSERHARDGMLMPHYLSGLAALVAQRVNLACCFDEFIAGASLGIAYFSMSRRRRDREGEPQRHPAKQRDFVS
ncbi:MAG TPA: DUF4254 domain-containing protein [Burkholderiales bacterium]|nr:DUF4254 domain-containing protein [Burkholderiales bacterium]